jgi:hypothetical protein
VCDLETSRIGAPCIYDISHLRVKQLAGWAPEPSWTFGKREISLASTGIQPLDSPSCSLVAVPTIPVQTITLWMHPPGGEQH